MTQSTPEDLTPEEIRRYGRHLILPEVGMEGQKRLKAARVLLVGAGGLGSPAALYLAAAGVGTIALVDDDVVDESNLQRQVLYGEPDVGRPKLEAAKQRLQEMNPHLKIETHGMRLDAENVFELIDAYDLVIDGSDNFPTRYVVNDACVLREKPLVWGAVLRFEGQLSLFWAPQGPCYRCLFPEPPPPGLVPSCAEGGVLGVLPGIIGSLQAAEAIKWILGQGDGMLGRLLIFDALRLRFREMRLKKSPTCPVCGTDPTIREPVQYSAVCATTDCEGEEEVSSKTDEIPFEIQVEDLQAWLGDGREVTVIDVREPHEAQICKIDAAKLIPMNEIPDRLGDLQRDALIVAHCHHGARSARVVQYLRQQGFTKATNLAGGINAWSARIDPSVPRY